jgi:hypothetical protein
MTPIIKWLGSMRASNLVFLSASPFIIFGLFTARNYGAALRAVLGIEENAIQLLISFLLLSSTALIGLWGALKLIKATSIDQEPEATRRNRQKALIALLVQALALWWLASSNYIHPYLVSILVDHNN